MKNENIKSEVVASFTSNEKVYIILELDTNSLLPNPEMHLHRFDFPSSDDFRIEFEIQGNKACIVLYYKDEEKWRGCLEIDCITKDKLSLFKLGFIEIYFKDISICPEGDGARVKLQLMGSAPIVGEKLILSVDRRIP